MNDTPLLQIGDLIMLLASVGGIVFAISYATFFRWRKTAAGRALLAFVVSLDLVFLVNLLGRFFGPDYAGREVVRIVVYSAVFVSIWSLVFILWRSWRRGDPSLRVESRREPSSDV